MAETRVRVQSIQGRAMAIQGADIDTDRIIPARFMKCVTFEGLGAYAFYDVRYNEDGSLKEHPFNNPAYKGASILVVNRNFGCGSSREHAPQALQKFGISALIGESFAEIFAGNCTAMGMPTLRVSEQDALEIQKLVTGHPDTELVLDLEKLEVRAGAKTWKASATESHRQSLIQGTWDSTGVLLENEAALKATEARLPYLKSFS